MHKVQRLWLVAFFWLLGLLAVSAGGSSITFNYDCGIRELTAYDAQFPPASVYDGAAILTANECWNRPAEIRAPFIKFAGFLAAKKAPSRIVETAFRLLSDLSCSVLRVQVTAKSPQTME